MTERLLEIENLCVAFPTRSGPVYGVKGVTMNVARQERLGVVGESGSGKSVTALAAMGLVQSPGRVVGGTVKWRGRSMFDKTEAADIRGRDVAMIFQDAMVSLHPLMTVERGVATRRPTHAGERSSCSRWSASPSRPNGSSRCPTSSQAECASG
jgi:peptide/nickel transport system ATP-binding protein